MPGLIGKKIGMTSVFGADGKNIPCTVIEAGPCVVTQIRTEEKDGYAAVQLAYDEMKEKHTSASLMGHFKKANTTPKRKLVEFKNDFDGELKLGDSLSVADVFKNEDTWVDVTGISKGKGLLVVDYNKVSEFKKYLVAYYEDRDLISIKGFLKSCLMKLK